MREEGDATAIIICGDERNSYRAVSI